VLASTTALTESRVHLAGRHCGSGLAAIGGTALAAVLWGTVGPLFTFYPAGAGIGFAFARLAVGAPVLLLLAARRAYRPVDWPRPGVVLMAVWCCHLSAAVFRLGVTHGCCGRDVPVHQRSPVFTG
jgi:hypothetical protein